MMAKRAQIFDIFQRSLKNDPHGSRKDQFKAFLRAIRESDDLVEQLAEVYFEQNYHRFKVQEKDGNVTIVGTPAEERRAEVIAARRQEREQQVETMAQARVNRAMDMVKKIVMLDMIMPNGKKLRHCTFAEVAKFGDIFAEISRHGKPNQVIDKQLNEMDLQNIRARFMEGRGRRSAGRMGAELHA